MIKKIWSFLNSKVAGYILVVCLALFIIQTCQNNFDLKNENKRHEKNEIALIDTIKNEKLKNGAAQVTISGLVASKEELQYLNKGLFDEVELQKGKVISINRTVISLTQTIEMLNKYIDSLNSSAGAPIILNDSTYILPWKLAYKYDSTNFDIFKGETKVGIDLKTKTLKPINLSDISLLNNGSRLIERTTQIDLTFGQKYEGKQLRVFVNSKYPGFSAKSLEGVLINPPDKQHWFNGWSVGIGATAGFNLGTGGYGLVVGPTFSYNIYNW
jgi:hypothetical protein